VHGESSIFPGQNIIHDGKNGLLDLSAIACSSDENQFSGKIHQDTDLGICAVRFGLSVKGGRIDQDKFRMVGIRFLLRGSDKHGSSKQGMPGFFGDDANGQATAAAGTGKTVLNEKLLASKMVQQSLVEDIETLRSQGLVYRPPPDRIMGGRVIDDIFVVWRPSGMGCGSDDNRPPMGEERFLPPDNRLIQPGGCQIPVDIFRSSNAMLFKVLCHRDSPSSSRDVYFGS
jgi:hypothetical protein